MMMVKTSYCLKYMGPCYEECNNFQPIIQNQNRVATQNVADGGCLVKGDSSNT